MSPTTTQAEKPDEKRAPEKDFGAGKATPAKEPIFIFLAWKKKFPPEENKIPPFFSSPARLLNESSSLLIESVKKTGLTQPVYEPSDPTPHLHIYLIYIINIQ